MSKGAWTVAKLQGRKQTARKKATSTGVGKRRKRAQSTKKKKTLAAPQLTFRQREKTDDAFIIDVTMQTLKDVYQQSVGQELREEHVLEWTNAGDYTAIIELNGKPVGYYSYLQHMPNRWYIGAMVLSPKAQGQGIGKQIFSHVEQQAREQGHPHDRSPCAGGKQGRPRVLEQTGLRNRGTADAWIAFDQKDIVGKRGASPDEGETLFLDRGFP